MAAKTYEKRVTAAGGVATCIPLEAPMRGMISRLLITQSGGTAVAFAFSILDRKGACVNAVDLNTNGGALTSVTDTGGSATLTTAEAHNLNVGDRVEVKGSTVGGYNTTHVVASVTSSTVVVTDIAYTADGAGGWWQVEPFIPTLQPVIHRVYPVTAVTSGGVHANYEVDTDYENRDNQSVTARRRKSALYLEITPEGTGSKTFDIAITVMGYIVD